MSKDVTRHITNTFQYSNQNIDSAIETFLLELDTKRSTKATYRRSLQAFFSWVSESGRGTSGLSRIDVLAYKDHLLDEGRSALTVNLYLAALRRFYGWLDEKGICEGICSGVSAVRTGKKVFRRMHLEDHEGAALLSQARSPKTVLGISEKVTRRLNINEELIAKRDYAMINLMLRTGLRSIEVSRADISDIAERRGKRILKVMGKGHSEKDDFVVLTDEAYQPIADYLAYRPGYCGDDPLFACEGLDSKGRRLSARRIQGICKERLRAIGLDGHEYSAHSLRHTTGTQILLNGGTLFDVQNVLRHTSPSTSQIYVNTIMDDKRIDDASESLLDRSFKDHDESKNG